MTRRLLAAGAALTVLLTACGGTDPVADPAPSTTAPDASATSSDDMTMSDPEGVSSSAMATDEPTARGDHSHPVLQSTATTPDGSTLAIADFAGKTVFVETFATWCSNCRRQLGDTNEAAAQVGDDVVFLVLSVEEDLDPAKLASYQADNGFENVQFAVLSGEGLAAFNEQFGRSVLNAPSTPKFIVWPDGSLSEMTTGFESPDEILAQLA